MRLFIGVFPPKETLDELRDIIRHYNKYKRNLIFPPTDQMHITLKYIGPEVSVESVPIISEYFAKRQNIQKGLAISFKKTKFGFNFDKFPRILFTEVEATDDLVNLADFYHDGIKELGLFDTVRWKNKFANTFHITLGRIKQTASRNSAKEIKDFTERQQFPPVKGFETRSVFLVQSITRVGKPVVYRKLEEFNI